MSESDNKRWAIIGGGVMGIALAEKLVQRGQTVTIIERSCDLGGLASGWQVGDVKWDRFYHVTLLSDDKLRNLLKRIGLDDQIRWITTKTGFYSGGKLYSMSNSWEFLNFPPLTLVEKLRLGGTIFYASKIHRWQPLEKIKVTDWLQKWSGRGTFEKIWLPLLKAKLGSAYDRASAAFIWAYISRMYKARRSGLKTEMFGYVPGGYARIMRAMQNRLEQTGVRLLFDAQVSKISRDENGSIRVTIADGSAEIYDRVITTAPAANIADTCVELDTEEIVSLKSIEYLGVVCASLVLKEPLSPYYVTNITDDWVPMTAVIEMSTVVDRAEFGGNCLVYLPKYLPSEDPGLDESHESILEKFIAALERMHPHFNRESIVASRVAMARKVMAIPTIDYSRKLPPIVTSIPGLYALNSVHITSGTLNVNESIELAEARFETEIWPSHQRMSTHTKR